MRELLRNLAQVGWGFLWVLGLHLVSVLFNTWSWQLMLPAGRRVPLRSLAPLLVAGDAVTAVNPFGLVGGELVRATLLRRFLPAPLTVSSVALAAMTQFVAQVLFVLLGLPIVLTVIVDARLRTGLMVMSAALFIALGAVLFLGWSRRPLPWIKRQLDRIHWFRAWWASLPQQWREVSGQTVERLRQRPGAFALSVGASLLGWQVGVIETLLILRLLHRPVGWSQALSIEVLAVAIEGALFFVPAKMGTQEGSKVLIFVAMGLDPSKGLALGFVRRLRELSWAAIGLAVLGRFQRREGPVALRPFSGEA